ncbi:MAG: HD domain-containing protein [Planctomycetes bacterium]|nr:HD domain-containing protein [Planctomycetota bacterium]
MKGQWIKDLADGDAVEGLFKVKEASLKTTRNGKQYIDAVLSDKTGTIAAKVWDATAEGASKWKNTALLEITGRVEDYKGRKQVIVKSAAPTDKLLLDTEAFEESSPVPQDDLKAEFKRLTGKIKDGDIRRLVEAVFRDREAWERFSTWPAATQYHHAYKHGLLEHTISMARMAADIAAGTGRVDGDYLLAGVFFHDVGKTLELTGEAPYDYTDRGRLLGHIHMGAEMVKEKAAELGDFPPEKLDRILHMILAHHGQPEFGSPVRPVTAEAVALHYIDNIDAKLQAADLALERDQNPGNWTEYMRMFETRLYKGHGGDE